jgi:hypothetical protein
VHEAFSLEDRDLFVACKRALSPARLNELTETAVEWLTERVRGDPEAFSDEVLRDKVDELVFYEVFGPDRRKPYKNSSPTFIAWIHAPRREVVNLPEWRHLTEGS